MSKNARSKRELRPVCIEDLAEEEQAEIRQILDELERSKREHAEPETLPGPRMVGILAPKGTRRWQQTRNGLK